MDSMVSLSQYPVPLVVDGDDTFVSQPVRRRVPQPLGKRAVTIKTSTTLRL